MESRTENWYKFKEEYVERIVNREIDFYESTKYANLHDIKKHAEYLKMRIGRDSSNKNTEFKSRTDRYGNVQQIPVLNMEAHTREINEHIYNMPWTKLKHINKCVKIREFVDNLEYLPISRAKSAAAKAQIADNRKQIADQLCKGLTDKRFHKGKSQITYDSAQHQITDISCLDYDDKADIYQINWGN